jgi:hypothetical protein
MLQVRPSRPDGPLPEEDQVTSVPTCETSVVFWHRDLPPIDAEIQGDHLVEADSIRVPGTLSHRDELWEQCYRDLLQRAGERIAQEVSRLGGHYGHVHDESIATKHNDAAGEAWLHGVFRYVLYSRPRAAGTQARGAATV